MNTCFNSLVNGAWSAWLSWGTCSVTCDIGKKTRYRNCNEPPPSSGGSACPGNSIEQSTCYPLICPSKISLSNSLLRLNQSLSSSIFNVSCQCFSANC